MPSLNLDLDFFDHRKTKRLVFLLAEGAELYLIRLWVYCGRFHPSDGRFSDESEAEIEAIAGWKGNAGGMLQAMLQACYMHKDEHGYFMHDWLDHQGHISRYSVRGKKMAEARWAKDAASNAASNARADRAEQSKAEYPHTPQGGTGDSLLPGIPAAPPPPERNGLHPEQLRLNAIFGRRPTTRWSTKEVRAWKFITPINEDDFQAIERYYGTVFGQSEKDYRRRDLCTLLNNWSGEVDRAKNFVRPSCL